jgi:DNA helicase II / ATP-dependent DNA helicase PcrA
VRMPKESELSREQKEVCFAPAESVAIVVGPPGSGKTIVALLRTRALAEADEPVMTVMFNRVLSRYTGQNKTFNVWVTQWWKQVTGQRIPLTVSNNGGWRPPDYVEATKVARSIHSKSIRTNGHWGHLIIDEAQDFDATAHRFLFAIQRTVFADLPEQERPSILILADENQRITSNNSTIDDLSSAYMIPRDDLYLLRKNYRNTREIARFAAQFYSDARSGVPDLPNRRGDPPKLVVTDGLDDSVARIVQHARLHEDEEIGVLVYYEKTRKRLFNKLSHRLGQLGIRVQTYSSSSKDHKNDEALVFDEPGVTVLCYGSSKGLEFDTVFLPEIQASPVDPSSSDVARMQLYVMCSRARTRLYLMISDRERTSDFWKVLEPQVGEDGILLYELEG